jgi:acetyl esterase
MPIFNLSQSSSIKGKLQKYRLPFKTRLMLLLISPFRRHSVAPPTLKQLQRARKPVPKFFLSTWVLGRMPKLHSVTNRMIPVREGEIGVRIYRPNDAQDLPLILNYHGGGWAVGNLQNNDYYCATLATEVGALVVSVDYRLAPEHKFPQAVYDAYDSLEWAVANAQALGADARRVCVTGDSAGGNLAAVVALKARDLGGPKISFQALIYPATDSRLGYASFEEHAHAPILTKLDILHYLDMYIAKPEDLNAVFLSPILAESLAGLPQALIVTAGYDPLCDDGQQYADRLQAEGIAVEVLHYPEDIHGFFTFPNHSRSGKMAIADVAQRIKAILR